MDQGVSRIAQIADPDNSTFLLQAWKSAPDLHIPERWRQDWEIYTEALKQAHIRITEEEDEIVWALAKNGSYTPKDGYQSLMEQFQPEHAQQWWKAIWKLKAAPRTRMLMWAILFNKIPTGTNLIKRSFHGPFWCHLCRSNEEDTEHIFLTCPVVTEHWSLLLSHIPSLKRWLGQTITEAWLNWLEQHSGKERNIPLLMCWAIWMARNRAIFDQKIPSWPTIVSHILADFVLIPDDPPPSPPRSISLELIDKSFPWAYFDGSAQAEGCE